MSGESRKPKPDLVAILRLEFYRKQKNWKLCRELRKEKDEKREEKDENKSPAASKILNSTYNIETEDGHSLLNQAFLEPETDKNTTPLPDSEPSTPKSSPGLNTTLDKWSPMLDTPYDDPPPALEDVPDIAVPNENLEEIEKCYNWPQNSAEFYDPPSVGNEIWVEAANSDEMCPENVEDCCGLNNTVHHDQNWLNIARFDNNWADEMTKSCQKWSEAMAKNKVNRPGCSKFDHDWTRNSVKQNKHYPVDVRQFPEPQDSNQNWPQTAVTQNDIKMQNWSELAQNTQNIDEKYPNDNTHTIVESVKPTGFSFENWTNQPHGWEGSANDWLMPYNVPQNSPQTPPNLLQPPPNMLQPPPNMLQTPPVPQSPSNLPKVHQVILQTPLHPSMHNVSKRKWPQSDEDQTQCQPYNMPKVPQNSPQTAPNLLYTPPNLPKIPQIIPQAPRISIRKFRQNQTQWQDVFQYKNSPEIDKNGCEGSEAPWATETSIWINGKVSEGIWSEDVIRELELLVARDLEPASPAETWIPQDQLLKWLLTESAEAAPAHDSSCDSAHEFMRGAHCAPHSTEIDLDLTGAEEVPVSGSSLAALSGRALSVVGQRHARALRTVAAEIRHRDRIHETIQQKNRPTEYPALPGLKPDSSCEEYPTRDIGLHNPSTNDSIITGSHRNNPNDKALEGNYEGSDFHAADEENACVNLNKETKEKQQILKLDMLKGYNGIPIKHEKGVVGNVKNDKIQDYTSEFTYQRLPPIANNQPFSPKEINNNDMALLNHMVIDNDFKMNRSWGLEGEVGRGRGRLHVKENNVGLGKGRGRI